MTAEELLELFGRAMVGDERAQADLAAVVPSLDALDVQWLHDLTHLHAELDDTALRCGHERGAG